MSEVIGQFGAIHGSSRRSGRVQVRLEIDQDSMTRLKRTLRALGETDAPYLRKAMEDVGEIAAGAVRRRAPGGIGRSVAFSRTLGTGGNVRALVTLDHPGAKSMEFGRGYYWTGYTGRKPKLGRKTLHRPGQAAKPYIGIIDGGHAIGEASDRGRDVILAAIDREWERMAGGAA